MGDRCYLAIYVHGEIKTMAEVEAIAKGMAADGLCYENGRNIDKLEDLLTYLYGYAKAGRAPEFHNDECNYANVSEAEQELQEAKIPYWIDHGSGDEYAAGNISWDDVHGRHDAIVVDGYTMIPLYSMEKAFKQIDPMAAIVELYDEAQLAKGAMLPKFSLGGELERDYAIWLAKQVVCNEA